MINIYQILVRGYTGFYFLAFWFEGKIKLTAETL